MNYTNYQSKKAFSKKYSVGNKNKILYFLFLCISLFFANYQTEARDIYVVQTRNLNVRTDASNRSKVIGTLHYGDTIFVDTLINNKWAEIEYNNTSCYVSKRYIQFVETENIITQEDSESSKSGHINFWLVLVIFVGVWIIGVIITGSIAVASHFDKEDTKKLSLIIYPIIGFVFAFIMCFIFPIYPETTYVWWEGMFHGGWLLPNWIISLFSDNWSYKAPLHTSAYNIWWWISAVLGVCTDIRLIISIISNIRYFSE
ncbi:MAG: SH3 domain-containing protein [Bacteroidales bacterium]|nr:SH3 domain-containing protein [Bacteroidales bacterium]